MPNAPWVSSKAVGWGAPKVAKVVRCSDIPKRFLYNMQDTFYCDSRPHASATISNVDEAYAVWRGIEGVWPPTKPCKDDQTALDQLLTKIKIPQLVGSNCSIVYPVLQKFLPGFDCDNSLFRPIFRDICCTSCGGKPIPADNPPPPPGPTPQATYRCSVCNHIYDAARDGGGKPFEELPDPNPNPNPNPNPKPFEELPNPNRNPNPNPKPFEELPDSWICPRCGALKAAYNQIAPKQWAHN